MIASNVRQPPRVAAGDRVGVAALSGPVDAEQLQRGLGALEAFGLQPVLADNLAKRHRLFAGDEAARTEAFHALAADPSLSAIFFARGGHGVLPILPRIDWATLRDHPRLYCGYSDLTPFLLQVVERLGLVALHGPMVASDFARGLSDAERAALWAGLQGTGFEYALTSGPDETIEGPLMGGCLSLLTASVGTGYMPDLQGSILFLEDVQEPLYRLDRMLHQLHLAGLLDGVRAIVWGTLSPPKDEEPGAWTAGWRELTEDWAERLDIPVLSGLTAGHGTPNLALPLGRPARLHRSGRLEVDAV